MKNHTLENTTETKAVHSPYQAKRAEAQAVPVSRPARAGDALLRLQRRVGNRAVQRLLVQRQEPEEEEELQMKPQAASLQRQELEEEEELMMKPDSQQVGLEGGQVVPEVEAAIQRARGGGQPLERTVQAQMSEALGHDLSGVRVHTGSEADALNHQLSARAFTTGHDIFFRRGEYNSGSGSGRELIAHELSHVVQQSTGRVNGDGRGMTVRPAGEAFEQEADRVAEAVTRSINTSVQEQRPLAQYDEPDLLAIQGAVANPALARPADILAPQRSYGNQAVQRLLAQRQLREEEEQTPVQTKPWLPGWMIASENLRREDEATGHNTGARRDDGRSNASLVQHQPDTIQRMAEVKVPVFQKTKMTCGLYALFSAISAVDASVTKAQADANTEGTLMRQIMTEAAAYSFIGEMADASNLEKVAAKVGYTAETKTFDSVDTLRDVLT